MGLTLAETFTSPIDLDALSDFIINARQHDLTHVRFNSYAGDQREPATLTLTATARPQGI